MTQMTQNVLVQSVNQFRITNEATGAVENEGATVRYMMTEEMAPFEDRVKSAKGYRPAKATIPYEDFHKFHTVPAIYEVALTYSVDSNGKAALIPADFKFMYGITVSRSASSGGGLNIKTKQE